MGPMLSWTAASCPENARDAQEALGTLHPAIQQVVVGAIGDWAPRSASARRRRQPCRRRQVHAPANARMVALLVLIQRTQRVPRTAPRHGGDIVHRHPGEAATAAAPRPAAPLIHAL